MTAAPSPAPDLRHALCRACHAQCGLIVEVKDGRAVKIHGDKDNPVYQGFSCIKGRALGAVHAHPARLLHSLKRLPGGDHAPIASERAMDEIADRLRTLVARHGPRAVAFYVGTFGYQNIPAHMLARALPQAMGTPMLFTSYTIDQPGKGIADALHGVWLAGYSTVEEWDRLLLIGTNPIVSMNGGLGMNPAMRLARAQRRGMKLVAIDPRRTDVAARADLFLQIRPGEDAAVLACMAHVLIAEGRLARDFVADNAVGLEALRAAVAPFTPADVAARAGVPAEALVEAARLFASGRHGAISAGTGPNMAGDGNLVEYLVRVLMTLTGYWRRAGERIANSGVLLRAPPPIAASPGPTPAFGFGERLRVRGLTDTAAGLPTAALADEILLEGEGQVRALIVLGGNPVAAWPDQLKVHRAMRKLDLLVTVDPRLTPTARLADYVIAPRMGWEVANVSMVGEWYGVFGPGWGYDEPYGQYSDPVLAPPAGADLIEDWAFLFGIARRLGLTLQVPDLSHPDPAASTPTPLPPDAAPTTDDIWRMVTKSAPVPFDRLRAEARQGRIFDQPRPVVLERPADWEGRLDIGNRLMLDALAAIANAGAAGAPAGPDAAFPYRLINRRLRDVLNSSWHEEPLLRVRQPTNAAHLNPADMAREGLEAGDVIAIRSRRATIEAVAQPEEGVRPGCVSISHCWGAAPDEAADPVRHGASTSRLVSDDADFDPYTGIPRMSNLPVSIRRVRRAGADEAPADA